MRVCVHSYCFLLGHVLWIQLGGLFCVFVLNGRRRGADLGTREVRWGRTRRNWGGKTVVRMHEIRIKLIQIK